MHIILSNETDMHADAVAHACRALGKQVEIVGNLAALPLTGSSIHIDGSRQGTSITLAGSPVTAVWNRRPTALLPPFPVAREDRSFVTQQWRYFLRGLADLTEPDGVFWINPLRAAAAAESKAHQLAVASRLGFRVPRTLMSCDPEEVRRFVGSTERVVFKSFSPFTWCDTENGSRHVADTREVRAENLTCDATIRLAPGIYQELVGKSRELRVTVIGSRIFAMEVSGGEGVDWRYAVQEPSASLRACALPASLERKIQALLKELGLVFGCLDLAVDENGETHFFEINQGGQFLFVEEKVPEFPLLAAITSMFLQRRVDYTLPSDCSSLSFQAYLQSSDFAACAERIEGRPIVEDEFVAFVG